MNPNANEGPNNMTSNTDETHTTVAPMGTYANVPFPPTTPWGKAQTTDILMLGEADDGTHIPVLWQVHTAGHGGTRVHRQLAARFLNGLPKECHAFGGSRLWYEEDCESCVPLFIFYNGLAPTCWLVRPENPYPREKLLESIPRWMPESSAAVEALAAKFDAALVASGTPLRSPLMPTAAEVA